jgi:cytochrome c-type biogenesis protein CcmH/NrfF
MSAPRCAVAARAGNISAPRRVSAARACHASGLRRALTVALACVSCCVPALGASAPALAATARASLPAIERQVMCVTCKIPLQVAESTQANDERVYIRELIGKGYDEARVKDALVAQYGPSVLGLPGAHGFDLTVYLVPAAVVLALLATVAVLLPRWRAQSRKQRASAASAPGLSGEEQELLERDMARYD